MADTAAQEVAVTTAARVRCTTRPVRNAASLAKFLSNHGWMRTANRSSQFTATIALNHKKAINELLVARKASGNRGFLAEASSRQSLTDGSNMMLTYETEKGEVVVAIDQYNKKTKRWTFGVHYPESLEKKVKKAKK